MNIYSWALTLTGLMVSGSTFRHAFLAMRGEGPLKLSPLAKFYWLGLSMIVAAGVCQMRNILCSM